MTPETLKTLDPSKTALLTLDLQHGILALGGGCDSILPNAARITDFARRKNCRIIHVGLGFSERHPEIPDGETPFLRVKQNHLFVKGDPSSQFHEAVIRPGDLTVYKQRFGAFSENHLELTLRARGIENLLLFGISTSGIVLSTVTRACDLDFRPIVIHDACFDPDPEVHRILTEKVFPKRGSAISTEKLLSGQS